MGVGIAFLRPREDGTWEGNYVSYSYSTFGEFQQLLISLKGMLYFLSFREEEYDVDVGDGEPPYPAWVTPELAEELEEWRKKDAPSLLEALRQIPSDQLEDYLIPLKTAIEKHLLEGYAIIVSY
jgi:hypothetical protein